MTIDELMEEYPQLTKESIIAAIAYVSRDVTRALCPNCQITLDKTPMKKRLWVMEMGRIRIHESDLD